MPQRKEPAGDLLTIVRSVPRPLSERGQLLRVGAIVELLGKSRWWVNHSFLPSKKIKIGRDSAWWERDVLEAIDNGDLTA